MDDKKELMDCGPEGRVVYDLQLVVTKQCNLHCQYCYVRQREEFMSLETAQRAVENGLRRAEERGMSLQISFMGGEPLLAFPMIRALCEWVWKMWPDKDIIFFSPTNGTLLTEEIRRWLSDHRERFCLGLSYDSALFQDENRSGSNGDIDVDFFLTLWPKQPFKMTISEHNVPHLAQSILTLHKKGVPFAANVACGQEPWQESSYAAFERELRRLVTYYLENPEVKITDLLDVEFQNVFIPRSPMLRRCGIGQNYENIDCNGDSYPCHLVSPLAIDPQRAADAAQFDFSHREAFPVAGCEACVLNQMCPKCYGMSYAKYGDPFRIDVNTCRAFQIQAKAACVLAIKRLYVKRELNEDERWILSAVKLMAREMHWTL